MASINLYGRIRTNRKRKSMNLDRKRGALLGQAIGDALGTTNEFQKIEPYEWEYEPRYRLHFVDSPTVLFQDVSEMFHEVELEKATKQERFIYEMGINSREENL